MTRLKGKRIMVTGAAQGIGLAIAEVFLSEGAALFLVDRDGPLLEMEAKRLQREGRALAYAEATLRTPMRSRRWCRQPLHRSVRSMRSSTMPGSTSSRSRWR